MIKFYFTGARSSVLRHFSVNDTLHGITIKDHLSEISNVVSSFSQEHGFIFNILKSDTTSSKDDSKKSKNVSISDYSNAGNKLSSDMKIISLTAANNTKSGVVVQTNRKAAEMIDFIIGSCNLFGNAEHGVDSLANASVTLSSCDIFDNHKSGVHVDQHSGGRTNIVNTTLSLNREYAINSVRANEIVLDSCEITNHNYGYHHYWYGWRTREYIRFSMNSYTDMSVIVRGNRFLHNVADGIHFDLRWSNRVKYNVTIENNLFENGNRTLVVSDSTYDYTNNENIISMNNNTFKNLSSIKSEIMRFNLRTSSELVIEHNHITDVTALNIIVIEGERVIRRNIIAISDNVISDNVVQDTVSLTSYQNNISLAGNILDNPGSECELKLPGFLKSSYSVNARFNYWGTENGSEVVRKVCGYDKDMTTSYVYYIPYYLNDELQLTMSQGQVSFSVAGALGGEIAENLILTKHNSPYRISRSLMIR